MHVSDLSIPIILYIKDYIFLIIITIINSALYLDKEFHTIDHLLYQLHLGVAKTVGVGNVKHTVNTGSVNTTCTKQCQTVEL